MGHGAASNILAAGFPLSILGHRNRAPVEDLVARGAAEASGMGDLVRRSDVVFLCLPSSIQVEQAMEAEDGILAAARPGLIVVDSTTADPASTRRLGASLRARGAGLPVANSESCSASLFLASLACQTPLPNENSHFCT